MTRITDFRRVERIGQGSFGYAELHERLSDRKLVVLKVMENVPSTKRSRVMNEITILKSLKHVNITSFYEAWRERNTIYICMEWADGGDLKRTIEESKRKRQLFEESKIRGWMAQLASALCYIHSVHILHRDLKSANVFLADGKRVIKLGDFGISKQLHSPRAMAMTTLGTPYYLSPEIAQGGPYNAKSDVWAAGVILYELMTHTYPYKAENAEKLFAAINRGERRAHSSLSHYSPDLQDLLDKMLKKDCRHRCSSSGMLTHRALCMAARAPVGRSGSSSNRQTSRSPTDNAVRRASPSPPLAPDAGLERQGTRHLMPRLMAPAPVNAEPRKPVPDAQAVVSRVPGVRAMPLRHIPVFKDSRAVRAFAPRNAAEACALQARVRCPSPMPSPPVPPLCRTDTPQGQRYAVPTEVVGRASVAAALACVLCGVQASATQLPGGRRPGVRAAWAPQRQGVAEAMPGLGARAGRGADAQLRQAEEEFRRTYDYITATPQTEEESDFEDVMGQTLKALDEIEQGIADSDIHMDGITQHDSLHTKCEGLCQWLEVRVGSAKLFEALQYLDAAFGEAGTLRMEHHSTAGRLLGRASRSFLPLVLGLARYKDTVNTRQ